jgi:hypothetical protein
MRLTSLYASSRSPNSRIQPKRSITTCTIIGMT